MGSHEEFRRLLFTAEATGLTPIVDSVLPLDEARTALGRMEAGDQFGKIVLRP
jgi:NADPH:quinone reductase-like Zn-dependent oxidoreductase